MPDTGSDSQPGRGRPRAQVTAEDVLAAMKSGLSFKEIAAKFEVSRDTVERRANPVGRADPRPGGHRKQNLPGLRSSTSDPSPTARRTSPSSPSQTLSMLRPKPPSMAASGFYSGW
jgi:hypothetical protein